MAITTNDVCARVRARLKKLIPVDDVPRVDVLIADQIRPALEALARKVAYDSKKRPQLLTDPATTTVVLDANGVADLSVLVTGSHILLECLRYGEIYPPVVSGNSTLPLRMVDNSGQGQVKGMFDRLQFKCWLVGEKLHTKSPNSTALAGAISLAVPRVPDLPDLPFSLEGELIDILVKRVDTEKEKNAA